MKRFWGNVALIALAHVVLIAALVRWSSAAKASSNPENIMWLGSAGDLSADESPSPEHTPPEIRSGQLEQDEAADETPAVTTVKSKIELPSATPKPSATATPTKRSATAAPKAKITPKPSPKPTPGKTVSAKVSPKISPKPKSSAAMAHKKEEKKDKIVLAKQEPASERASGQSGSTGKTGSAGGRNSASEFGWYGNMLHDRFYSAWIQPTMNVPSGARISTLVNVRIEQDGRISKFEIAKPSANATVNESVAAVAKQVSQVDPPPTALFKGDHYDVKINFELNTKQPEASR